MDGHYRATDEINVAPRGMNGSDGEERDLLESPQKSLKSFLVKRDSANMDEANSMDGVQFVHTKGDDADPVSVSSFADSSKP